MWRKSKRVVSLSRTEGRRIGGKESTRNDSRWITQVAEGKQYQVIYEDNAAFCYVSDKDQFPTHTQETSRRGREGRKKSGIAKVSE